MKIYLLIIIAIAMQLTVRAQQDPMFSQNMYNHMTVNPGFAGMRGNWVISGIYRNQWQKMDDAPETYALNIDVPFRVKQTNNGVAVGLMSENLGMLKHMQVMLNYAYKAELHWGMLNVGAKIGLINTSINGTYYIPDMDGSTTPGNDPALGGTEANVSKSKFDAGIGVFLTGKNFYAGVSLSHLTKPKVKIGEYGEFFWKQYMTVTGGYSFKLSPVVNVQPSFFFRTDFVTNQYILNANFIFKERYWGGLSYSRENVVSFLAGFELKEGVHVGYSYDWNVSNTGQYLGGSHEITLSYRFGLSLGKSEKIYKSIRFL
ncbi:type IX secretion system membrane protein PorP/SprF [Porphyromonadaceae bacterium OttesenSCG-928-L07]|nr:type IX secretion system membrane protein PorP/SprF [Porphyromonadaceae bacterium OttesenSCG-928-L07]MDL2251618.1 type IX secretion system membrane protein PorP/SprF [Odoribacter sp. OttesenSCG-928-J03]MDL2330682.1 type IX secretion system membrane protein PorP/SprF [Odoribacter sp. OttesenSCG-928-A06]